ncbi:hypothetical protein F511_15002 [Dorcoceras hygrometricum]|uniref:Uncharacterized protein n=1 Tax=Dorcoceras hygrometricum TaxID=472368 RepID=A0A2Z7CLF7_9LAMI|nr:hypothetical protein F511_15002 [Dorcoceras hygrometricum]
MASAYYSNTQHIDFESVLAMDDLGMVSMFQAIMASGLEGFLGFGAEEAAGAPKPKAVSKKRPAAVLGDEPVVKKKRTMKKKSSSSKVNLEIVAVAQEAVPIQMVEPTTAASSVEDIFTQPAALDEIPAHPPADETVDEEAADEGAYEETADGDAARVDEPASEPAVVDIVNEEPSIVDDVDIIIEQSEGNQPAGTAEERQWFDLPNDDLIARWDAERIVTTPIDTDEVMETERTVGTADGVETESSHPEYIVEEPEDTEMSDDERSADDFIDADEKMSLDEIILTIPAEIPLPSAEREVTKITISKEIKIPGVDEKTWYLASLPQIPVDDKGKEPLQLIDPIKGKPPHEHYFLICADIDMLVQLWEKVIDEVAKFFYSLSLKRLANIQIDDCYFAKEELVLSWAEAESTGVALQRKMYILLKKGKPPHEHYFLICADIDMLVQLWEKVIDEVAKFFYSLSLKRLANIQIDDCYFAKEELVLSWAEAESTGVALQRKMYILLKYRAFLVRKYLDGWILNFVPGEGDSTVHLKVIDMLSDLLSFVLEELKQQAVAHRIRWDRPCCSILFEGRLTSHRCQAPRPGLDVNTGDV